MGALFVGLDTPLKVHCNLNFMKKTLKWKSIYIIVRTLKARLSAFAVAVSLHSESFLSVCKSAIKVLLFKNMVFFSFHVIF